MTPAQLRQIDIMLQCIRLSVWDMNFLESLSRQLSRTLSQKQLDTFDRIARKAGLGGVDAEAH